MNKKQLGIYVHIPFCQSKCVYCDFLSAPADGNMKSLYIKALLKEIRITAQLFEKGKLNEKYCVASVFFGGGTPSILDSALIEMVLDYLFTHFTFAEHSEITIECNPGTLTLQKARNYKRMGINRISFGLQSADDTELKMLGRIHEYKKFLESYENARNQGFDNINVDIMSALPGQTMKSYMDTLNKVTGIKPDHISAYSLIVEENTPLYDNIKRYPKLPDEDTERRMYYETEYMLERNGYKHYEISNYAKSGKVCIHNLSYWERKDYLGFGLGASSLFEECRYTNISDINRYISFIYKDDKLMLPGIRAEINHLTKNEQMEEFMFLGLRKMDGIDIKEFSRCFGCNIDDVYGRVIERNTERKLLKRSAGRIWLTDRGVDVSNVVMSEFLLS